MKRLAVCVLAAVAAAAAHALEYKTVDIRRTGGSPVRETFWAGDSIAFGYALEEDSSAYDLTPWDMVTWEMCTYTNPAQCWMGVTGRVDDAESGELSVETTLPLSVVPEGQYRGYVKGLQLTESNTVARQRVLVEQVVTVRYGQTEFPPDAEDNSGIIEGNAYARISDVENEAAIRQHADNILSNAIAVISSQGGGEPVWPASYLPAQPDGSSTNEAYVVEFPTTFLLRLVAPGLAIPLDDDEEAVAALPTIPSPFSEPSNNGLARFNSVSRSYGTGLVLNSSEGSFLRLSLGDLASLVLSKPTRGASNAKLKAGVVDIEGDTITLTASVYDEEDDETRPGVVAVNGNLSVDGDAGVDGDVDVTGDVAAATMTLGGVQRSTWPEGHDYSQEIGALQEAVAENAGDIADNSGRISDLQTQANANAAGVSSNATRIAVVDARIDTRIDSLYGKMPGGWKWPDYFRVKDYVTGVKVGSTTNETLFRTNTVYNIIETLSTNTTLLGWKIEPEILRMATDGDAIHWEPVSAWKMVGPPGSRGRINSMDPSLLEVSGNFVYFKPDVTELPGGWAVVRGTLGGYVLDQWLMADSARQAAANVVSRFKGPAPGSLMAQCWSNILLTASNAYAQTPRRTSQLRTWPEGYGSGTSHVTAGWNTNFWVYGLGDFSCISYHTDTTPGVAGGIYRPVTMVTPRHGIVANHWKPLVGSNVYWVTRSGTVITNRVIAYKNLRSDLTVARLAYAFDTNDIAPATLLQSDFNSYTYGSTNRTQDCLGFPILSFTAHEIGWVSGWRPSSLYYGKDGRNYNEEQYVRSYSAYADGLYDGPYKGNGVAVGGDSGSPSFVLIDGKTVLLGCYYTAPGGGPMPHKGEVDAAIKAWGDEEECTEYSFGDGHWPSPDGPPGP